MVTERFTASPHFKEYEALLRELHVLIARGLGDSEEADALRDEMDIHGSYLDAEDITRLQGLSADLYMLSDDEIFETDEAAGTDAWAAEVQAARDAREWETVLSLLRKSPASSLPQAPRAYLRALAYAALGQDETSLLFARHALTLDSDNVWYRLLVVQQLTRMDRREDALAEMATQADLTRTSLPRAV